MKRLAVLLLLLAMLILPGCGIIDYFYLPVPDDTAQELYEIGVESMEEKDYYTAIEYFVKLTDRYPFSPYTTQAELSLADAYFLDGQYEEAMQAYMDFEAMHPRHEEIPYVLYQIGVSAYKSFQGIDRPQNQVAQGLQYLYRLRETYPGTEYAQAALDYIDKSRRLMAEREVFVADFYWSSSRWGAAWRRYQYVVDNFSDLEDIKKYASERSNYAYLEYQKERTKKAREKREGSWKDWFKWL